MNIIITQNISEDDAQLISEISKRILENPLTLVNVTDDDIVFNQIYDGDWFCMISNLPSTSNDVIENLVVLSNLLENQFGVIIGNYDSLLNEYGYLLVA